MLTFTTDANLPAIPQQSSDVEQNNVRYKPSVKQEESEIKDAVDEYGVPATAGSWLDLLSQTTLKIRRK